MAVSLGISIFMIPGVLRHLAGTMANDWQLSIASAPPADPRTAVKVFGTVLGHAATGLAPLVAAIMAVSLVSQLVMVGPRPNPHNLKPKFERVNPKNGIKRILSKQSLYELFRNLAKLSLLTLVAWGTWQAGMRRMLTSTGSLDSSLAALTTSVGSLLRKAALLAVVIGVVDAVVAKRRHVKSMRMSKQEIKEEHKQAEGNGEMKGMIRGKQRKMSRMRMIAAVAKADVVLANPTHLVVALAYDPGASAPRVVAKGAGVIADRIKDEARKHGVPILQNKPLARAIYRAADIGDEIPAALYRAVAEVLALVYKPRRKAA